MRIPGPIILLVYVIAASMTIRILTGMNKDNYIGIILLLAAAVLGLFVVIAYLAERGDCGNSEPIAKRAVRGGLSLFKIGLVFFGSLFFIGVLSAFLSH
jgi:hypothetical protein